MSEAFRYRFPIRVRYAEVDPQSVVFNSRYLEYADIAVTEYWRAMGCRPGTSDTPECHVGTATVRYVKPIRLDELIETRTRIERFGTASMTWSVELHGEGEGDDLRAAIELVYVGVDLATGRSQPLPEAFKAQVRGFQGE
ncbi:acyl-CoA thioesterase [Sphingomonas sp. ID1715]|uniref:acyl-CoA thioesterase n=1 Tax=Sphingomonas sp. ID1715 TaxID=1656898 RepID=UPI001489FD2F|nr:thioesterase family protein [Sphingomonas sp. ID1715]NNM77201.1 acyl-CoA thioesterase [Sphingomonas sp. ID1715]